MIVHKAPGIRTKGTDGREYLIQLKNVTGSVRDTLVELLGVVYCGDETVWSGRVGIFSPDVLAIEQYFPQNNAWAAGRDYWVRILARIAFPSIQQSLLADELEDEFHVIPREDLEAYFVKYGPQNRPCEFFDDAESLTSYCGLARKRGVEIPIGRNVCTECELPEPFLRCQHLNLLAVHESSTLSGVSPVFVFGCREGRDEFTEPGECFRNACFEHLLVEDQEAACSAPPMPSFAQQLNSSQAHLRARCPEVLAVLSVVADQLRPDASAHELAGPANACRRALRALADQLQPAGGRSSDGHVLSEDKWINRLREYMNRKAGSETNAGPLVTSVEHLEARIKRLNELASKGTHDDIDIAEAERCAHHTLQLILEILDL